MVFNGARLKILQTIKGELPKNQQAVYLLIIFGWHYALLLFSIIVYPTSYNIFDNFISDLGMPERNPKGYILFMINAISMGFLLIPHILYLFKSLKPCKKSLYQTGLSFGIIGCISNMFMAIFPEDLTSFSHNFMHVLTMFLDYFCFLISSLIMFKILFKKSKLNSKGHYQFNDFFWVLPYIPLFIFIFVTLIYLLSGGTIMTLGLPLQLTSVYFWQWFAGIGLELWIIGAYFITPMINGQKG